jgi:4'-phosphopantetheinyl transferase
VPRPSLVDQSIVHVCPFSASHYADRLADLSQCLSEEEREHARRFIREADRCRFILGRAIVRHLCGMHSHIEPAIVRLGQTPAGKPYVINPISSQRKRFEFSVAHSGNCVLVAWAEGQIMGVDVEAVDRHSPALIKDVSASAFSPQERDALFSTMPDELANVFYRIWVRKEALLKAEGCGLGGALQSFSVAHRHLGRTVWPDKVIFPVGGRSWSIADLVPAADHAGALALPEGSAMRVHQSHEVVSWMQG